MLFSSDDVVRHVLPNGLTLLVREDHTAPVVAIVTYVKAGYFDETDDVAGIAHVLEHMFFKGTPTRGVGEIARQTKAAGGYLNASTIYDHTRYYAVVPSASFAEALEIQADAWANAAIDAGELGRELEVIIEEAKRKADTPEAVTTETLFELLHDRHRIRRWRIGHPDGLRALRREHLMGFYRTWYQPSETVLSIVGDVPAATVIREVERWYAPIQDRPAQRDRGPVEDGRPGRRYRTLRGDVSQSHGAFGWRVPGHDHADSVPLDLAATLLAGGRSSRLYQGVRDRRLVASITAWNYTPADLGVFVVQWSGDAATRDAAAREAWTVVQQVADGVGEGELERARRLHTSRTLRRLESMDGQANWLADWESMGGWERGLAYEQRLATATSAEVRAACATWLAADQASWLRYDPRDSGPVPEEAAAAFAALGGGEGRVTIPAMEPGRPAPPLGRAEHEETVAGVDVFRTRGGVPLLVRATAGAPMVHLALFARGGAAADPVDMDGLALLMARTALKGTSTRNALALASASELAGGSVSASATADGIGWGISVPRAQWEVALELLADVALHPTLEASAFDVERGVALAQVAQLRDDMYRYPLRLAVGTAWASHPYGRSAAGSEAGLGAATAAAARELHEQLVLRGDLALAVTGDVDAARVAALAAHHFAGVQQVARAAVPVPTWQGRGQVVVEGRDKAQTAMVMAFPGPGRREDARFVAHVLAAVTSGLGGRFFDALREQRSLAYTVHAGPTVRAMGGLFLGYIATSPAREAEAREGLLAEFARLRDAEVSQDELERARRYVVGTHAISRQNPSLVLDDLLDAWMHGTGLAELAAVTPRLGSVTAADIQRFAREAFDPERRVEGVVRGR